MTRHASKFSKLGPANTYAVIAYVLAGPSFQIVTPFIASAPNNWASSNGAVKPCYISLPSDTAPTPTGADGRLSYPQLKRSLSPLGISMKMFKTVAITLTLLAAATAQAQDTGTAAARAEAACTANPDQCTQLKARADQAKAKLQAQCAANPDACAEKKANVQARIANRKARRAGAAE